MKLVKKDINIDFYAVYYQEYDKNKNIVHEYLYDIKPILDKALETKVKDRCFNYNNETARLQQIELVDNLWQLQFVRIRKDYTTGLATDDGEFKNLGLKDNQGLGESVSAIYDSEVCVLTVQRNRDGMLPSGILEFLQKAIKDDGIIFKPIIKDKDLSKFKKDSIYRRIEIGFVNLKPDTKINTKLKVLSSLFKSIKEYEPVNFEINLGVGRSLKSMTLKPEEIRQTILDLNEHVNVNKLMIHYNENSDTNIEKVDLIKNRLRDNFSISYKKDETPENLHKIIIEKMIGVYFKHKPLIEKKFKEDRTF